MKVTVDVSVEDILVARLKEDYQMILKDQVNLKKSADVEGLAFYEIEDYMNNKRTLKHLKGVLSYYMIMEEFNEFIKGTENV